MAKRVLVTGGSVAGNTLAWWLGKRGFDVTVVEKAPRFREGGQSIDVRGAGRKVLDHMGLLDAVKRKGTGEKAWTFVDEEGDAFARFALEDLGADGLTAEIEVLRGELSRTIYESVRGAVAYRFGDAVAAVDESDDSVGVSFTSGLRADYDLLIVAEGVGSPTRELVFKGENRPRWMDLTMAYFTIPKGATDTDEARWYDAPGGRNIFLRPDNLGTTRAVLSLQEKTSSARREAMTEAEQKAWLQEVFADAGWEVARVLEGLRTADDLYFDVLRQVKMQRWVTRRVALVGDAAWCATPLSGIGTTLAIVGAYVMAGELSKNASVATALAAYERVMRPYVERGQGIPKLLVRLAHPHSRLGLKVQRRLLSFAATPMIRGLFAKASTPPADRFVLPEYDVGRPGTC